MGYLSSDWVKPFLVGKTIKDVCVDQDDHLWLAFTDGTSFMMYSVVEQPEAPKHDVICTPYDKDGEVMQAVDIMEKLEKRKAKRKRKRR